MIRPSRKMIFLNSISRTLMLRVDLSIRLSTMQRQWVKILIWLPLFPCLSKLVIFRLRWPLMNVILVNILQKVNLRKNLYGTSATSEPLPLRNLEVCWRAAGNGVNTMTRKEILNHPTMAMKMILPPLPRNAATLKMLSAVTRPYFRHRAVRVGKGLKTRRRHLNYLLLRQPSL